MKILAIGNSFSQDATKYLMKIAESAGEELLVRNLYIGGCSLQMHVENIRADAEAYQYEMNAEAIGMISVSEALRREDWDFVTIQQVSHQSGLIDSYEPYISELINTVRAACPRAEIVIHRTWAYEIDSTHSQYPVYNCDQELMYNSLMSATEEIAKKHSLRIIPSGDFVQHLRSCAPFNYRDGGLSLCRDGFHMSYDYGRYAVALVWFNFFTAKSCNSITFAPENTDPALISFLRSEADAFLG